MKLRNKVLIILGVGLVGLSTSFYLVSRTLLSRSYAALEEQQLNQDMQRVLDAVNNEVNSLARQAFDYAHWDAAYEYMEERNQEFIEENVSILNIKANVVLFIDPSGTLVSAQAADLDQRKVVPVSKALLSRLSSSPLVNHKSPDSEYKGIVRLPEGPMMLASYPIVTSASKGPIRGTLIMGRYLNATVVQQLSELTKLPNLTIESFDADSLPPDLDEARQVLQGGTELLVEPLNQTSVAAYATLQDIDAQPALLVRVTEPRRIYAQGQASLDYLVFAILATGALSGVAILLFLEKSILSRLDRLSAGISRAGRGDAAAERVMLPGGDELSDLATTFNQTLDQLEQFQQSLRGNAERLQRQNAVLADLSHDESLLQGNLKRAARAFTEATAETLAVERVSVWLYTADQAYLNCLDLYERTPERHSSGLKWSMADCPRYGEALTRDGLVDASDAQTDARTRELVDWYLAPLQITSLLALPIQVMGRTVGVVCCEQLQTRRQWQPEEQTFIYSIANLVSLALESETLQREVGHLLDIVSLVSEGNLTVQAQVSDRITGLVADTFNQLIERLSQILHQVLQSARQVTEAANRQKQLAGTVATNAEQQAQAVSQVLSLTEQVQQAAQGSAEKATASSAALQTASTTVALGQNAIATLTQGIAVLQEGTDRIVQRMKTLGEFVGLADQFVQDQSQIAFITQTLALNASLVAARASEQQDPRQFVVVAREFDSIADQVSKLAQQTSEGLTTIEQRSTQIHSLVSAVDADVQSLGELVRKFTYGVDQSNQAFQQVQSVTEDAVQTGEAVAQFSQTILEAAQTTAHVMQNIAGLATRTAELTQLSRAQSTQIDQLAAQLLQSVQFFNLPDGYTSFVSAAAGADASASSPVDQPQADQANQTEQTNQTDANSASPDQPLLDLAETAEVPLPSLPSA
jgi:twitching motility protein PilJ